MWETLGTHGPQNGAEPRRLRPPGSARPSQLPVPGSALPGRTSCPYPALYSLAEPAARSTLRSKAIDSYAFSCSLLNIGIRNQQLLNP